MDVKRRAMAFTAVSTVSIATSCGGALVSAGATVDAGVDVERAPLHDASTLADTSPEPDTSMVCPPDVSSFVPPPYVPAAVHRGSCSTQQIADYDAACLNSTTSTPVKCSAFQVANAACSSCLLTQDSASGWGALINHQNLGFLDVNVAGCMEIEGNVPCAVLEEALAACEAAACDFSICPNPWEGQLGPGQCYQAAATSGCKKYAVSLAACSNDDGGPITTKCLAGVDFDSKFLDIAPLFCGP